jgi:FecR protein
MTQGSFTEGGNGIGASTEQVDASRADRIDIPDAALLFRGHFAHAGPDLILTGEDGHRLVITAYFASEKHPDLVAPNGAHLTGDLVDLLAGSPTPGQYAQAKTTLPPEAIGKVEKVVGLVTLIHNGVAGPLHVGDPVFKTDVVQTGANSSCGIAFPDGTALDLVNNTRMALNEYNFEPNSAANGALFSLVEGTFAFVAGQVAHTGDGMKINTPVATMGIRGTVGLFRSEPTVINSNLGHVWSAFLHEDIDGSHQLGRIALIDQDPASPTFGQTFFLLDSSDYIAYLEPQGASQPPHVRLEPNTNSKALENRHFFNDLGKILELYNNADPQTPSTPGSGDNPSDLFQRQLLQDDGGKPLLNFGKLSGSDSEITFGTSLPLIPVVEGLRPNTNTTTSNEATPHASTVFIWNGTGAWPTALANWNSGAPPNSSIDSVILQTGTATFNVPNTTISFLTIDPGATLDIVGGLLSTHGLIDNGTINVDGDPPALMMIGPAVIGSGGTLTAQDGSISFTNGSLLNAGTLTADFGGSVLINESGISSGTTRAIDGGVVTIENGAIVNSVDACHVGNGDGDLSLVNENCGTIDANSCEQALTVDTGCNQIANTGTLAADNGGVLDVASSVNNTGGSIRVSDGGFADFQKDVSGGTATIHGGTLEFDAASNVNVEFDNGLDADYGKFILKDWAAFTGDISGFAGCHANTVHSDEIELLNFTGCNLRDAACYASHTNITTLTIWTSTNYVSLQFVGDFTANDFVVKQVCDNVLIFDPPETSSPSGPSVSIGSGDTFVFHPGEGAQTVNNFNPKNDTIELDHFVNVHNMQELAAAIAPDVHGNAVTELGHGDCIVMPGVNATFLQQNLQNLLHLHV